MQEETLIILAAIAAITYGFYLETTSRCVAPLGTGPAPLTTPLPSSSLI